jgi:hypothetical protein
MGGFNNLFFVLRRNATGIVRPSAHPRPLGQALIDQTSDCEALLD